jgi:nucleotide-binding universal stress UspA family protein
MTDAATGHHVAVGVDGSTCAARAAMWAADEAAARGIPLRLVHARGNPYSAGRVMPLPYTQYNARQADAANRLFADVLTPLRRAHPDLPIATKFVEDTPSAALLAAGRDADVLVLGNRGRGGFAGLLLGSIGLSVAAHATRPTVIVRGETARDDGRAEILLGLDTDEPEPPVSFAFAAARRANAAVRAMHVWQLSSGDSDVLDMADEADIIGTILKPSRRAFPDVTATTEVTEGSAVKRLVEAAAGARLLVVGSHRRHGPLSPGVGLVLHGLLHHAPCPIAIVPTV